MASYLSWPALLGYSEVTEVSHLPPRKRTLRLSIPVFPSPRPFRDEERRRINNRILSDLETRSRSPQPCSEAAQCTRLITTVDGWVADRDTRTLTRTWTWTCRAKDLRDLQRSSCFLLDADQSFQVSCLKLSGVHAYSKAVPLPYFEIAGQAAWFDHHTKANTEGWQIK